MTTYADTNFKTKKALKDAVKAGKKVGYYNPGMGTPAQTGVVTLSGPHYPAAHSWYAECKVEKGLIVAVK